MSKTRVMSGAAAAGLMLWIVVLFFLGPAIRFAGGDSGTDIAVRCSPPAYYLGFGLDYQVDDIDTSDGGRMTFTVTDGEVRQVGDTPRADVYGEINTFCDRERTGRVALMALLAGPAAALAVLALRRRPAADDHRIVI